MRRLVDKGFAKATEGVGSMWVLSYALYNVFMLWFMVLVKVRLHEVRSTISI